MVFFFFDGLMSGAITTALSKFPQDNIFCPGRTLEIETVKWCGIHFPDVTVIKLKTNLGFWRKRALCFKKKSLCSEIFLFFVLF